MRLAEMKQALDDLLIPRAGEVYVERFISTIIKVVSVDSGYVRVRGGDYECTLKLEEWSRQVATGDIAYAGQYRCRRL